MLRPLIFALSALLVPATGIGAAGAASPGVSHPMPALKIDRSPVGEGQSALVTSYADIVEPVQRAVVSVYSTKIVREEVPMAPILRQFFGGAVPERESKQEGLGSGVIVSAGGYILTNNHVVADADELKVLLPDGREFIAKVIGTDPKTDIAVIKIDVADLPFVTLADSDKLRVGDIVFAVGNPLDVGQTVTMGIISAKGRTKLGLLQDVAGYESFIQTDAAINPGNSGGALIDAKGRLIGINSAIFSNTHTNIGIGFAIPVNLAASIMTSLIETGKVTRGNLGVTTELVGPENAEAFKLPKDVRGLAVTDLAPGGPAQKAGVKRADVIVGINDRKVTSVEEMRLYVAQLRPGAPVQIKVMRDGVEHVLNATVGILDDQPDELLAGVKVAAVSDDVRRSLGLNPRIGGVLITNIAPDSDYRDRLVEGVVIVEINRTAINDPASARAALRPGRNLFLVYFRGVFRYVTVAVK
ncbi:Do family serine endopeptidase [Horticoccus luteus]|uniref:Do family serine endopeptidase n=1 Tax=Horticoccus luteus TaxID=2862869 RepID=A0A8F9TVH7_9BACT|nr:Do family serine endopeptidase [Horticoccus luteus]QYM78347.1 Do family serine endopeptidase [Horticoccus luteus]